MLQDNVKIQAYCSIERKKSNTNELNEKIYSARLLWESTRQYIYGKNRQNKYLKIRISVNGFLKRKDIYSTYG